MCALEDKVEWGGRGSRRHDAPARAPSSPADSGRRRVYAHTGAMPPQKPSRCTSVLPSLVTAGVEEGTRIALHPAERSCCNY